MTQLEKLQDFYLKGTDPEFSPNPNHIFVNMNQTGGEKVILFPGHFYSFQALQPVGPDQVPTWDEYEMMKNPSLRDQDLIKRYGGKRLPYYDNRPIFLALSGDGWGLNVKVMSQFVRKKFIRTYLNRMSTAIEACFEEGELLPFTKRPMRPFVGVNSQMVKTITGIPDMKYDLLVNKYNRENMRNLTLIDWDQVPNLHLANYSTDKTISARSAFSLFELK